VFYINIIEIPTHMGVNSYRIKVAKIQNIYLIVVDSKSDYLWFMSKTLSNMKST